jgi:molybdate transport system substrate-binding protein
VTKNLAAFCALLALVFAVAAEAQQSPPWSRGANNPAARKDYVFHVPDIDNVPDLHGNPTDARLVLFIGGNQFFVLPHLIAGFEARHPELNGRIFYETLPPGILRKQIAADDTLTLGNLTLQVRPDIYEAGQRVLREMENAGQVTDVIDYATNTLAIMVAAGNPKHITGLRDLGAADLRLSMPNPQWEGVARQVSESLRKAGGDSLVSIVYRQKVSAATTLLTEIHHRQTPMWIMEGKVDAGLTWASEVEFPKKIANPIAGVAIPDEQNTTAIYAAGMVKDAPHADAAREWLDYLRSPEAQSYYHEFGFRSLPQSAVRQH